MKKYMKYIAISLVAILAITSLGFSESKRKAQLCTGIHVDIEKGNYDYDFIVESDVISTINKEIDSITTKKVEDIRIHDIEEKLRNHPSILSCETFISNDGLLHVKLQQRSPILRVISTNDSYYIDENGRLMPLSHNYTARTIVASGNIKDGFRKRHNVLLKQNEKTCLHDLFVITNKLLENDILSSMIEQIYVTEKGEYVLVSKIGPPIIELGTVKDLETKLKNLNAFYNSKKTREHWNKYKRISVKFKNQIVCTKS